MQDKYQNKNYYTPWWKNKEIIKKKLLQPEAAYGEFFGIYIYVHTYIYTYTYIYVYIHTYIYIYIYIYYIHYTHTHKHIHTNTHLEVANCEFFGQDERSTRYGGGRCA
jgi:hypothetical protein